jgi:hypothetical protein
MTSSIQGFSSLSINLDKSKTDLENAKGTNKVCAVTKADSISNHRTILSLGSFMINSQINA